jgi:hypothetical protein
LRGRYQRVFLHKNGNKCCSECKEIQCGVHQGSVLGLVLFLLYINDLPRIISDLWKPVLFAYDTSVLISDKDPTDFKIRINKLMNLINKWCIKNLLVINYKKLAFCSCRLKIAKMLDIQVNCLNNQIPSYSNISFLGLKIHKFLTWKTHVEVLIDKVNRSCFVIWSLKSILQLET